MSETKERPLPLTRICSRTKTASPVSESGNLQSMPIWGGVPLRNPYFTGRESLLLQLRKALEEKSKASVLPQVLHGPRRCRENPARDLPPRHAY